MIASPVMHWETSQTYYNPSQKSWTPSEESPPPLPLIQCCYNDVNFSFGFFFSNLQWGKGSYCPMFLSEIVAVSQPGSYHLKNSFRYSGAILWNSLPKQLRQADRYVSLNLATSRHFLILINSNNVIGWRS